MYSITTLIMPEAIVAEDLIPVDLQRIEIPGLALKP
jgi:hypothetical protein